MTTMAFNDRRRFAVVPVGSFGEEGRPIADVEPPAQCGATVDVVDELAAVVMPPVKECLVLADHLREDVRGEIRFALDGEASTITSYTWYREDNFDRAHSWYLSALATQKADLDYRFFVEAIVNLYQYDRALRGAKENGKDAPVRDMDIPQFRGSNRLVRRGFVWSRDIPHVVTDTVGAFVRKTPPDKFWIAVYVCDPILYASFGPWQVEVARWD